MTMIPDMAAVLANMSKIKQVNEQTFTFNHIMNPGLIADIKEEFGTRCEVKFRTGAGTVLTFQTVDDAIVFKLRHFK